MFLQLYALNHKLSLLDTYMSGVFIQCIFMAWRLRPMNSRTVLGGFGCEFSCFSTVKEVGIMANFFQSGIDRFRSDMLECYLQSYFSHTGADAILLIRKDMAPGILDVGSMEISHDGIFIKFNRRADSEVVVSTSPPAAADSVDAEVDAARDVPMDLSVVSENVGGEFGISEANILEYVGPATVEAVGNLDLLGLACLELFREETEERSITRVEVGDVEKNPDP
jgi:hypothetical protein